MGKPKLLMPWRDQTIMDHVLGAWTESRVDHVIVVMRKDDHPLRQVCSRWPVEVVRPERHPADMKASIQVALRHIDCAYDPSASDLWMVAPADLPRLSAELINAVADAARDRDGIVIPQFGGHQGHPVAFPWGLASEVFSLAANEGLDRLIARHAAFHLALPAEDRVEDVDTPEDYRRLGS